MFRLRTVRIAPTRPAAAPGAVLRYQSLRIQRQDAAPVVKSTAIDFMAEADAVAATRRVAHVYAAAMAELNAAAATARAAALSIAGTGDGTLAAATARLGTVTSAFFGEGTLSGGVVRVARAGAGCIGEWSATVYPNIILDGEPVGKVIPLQFSAEWFLTTRARKVGRITPALMGEGDFATSIRWVARAAAAFAAETNIGAATTSVRVTLLTVLGEFVASFEPSRVTVIHEIIKMTAYGLQLTALVAIAGHLVHFVVRAQPEIVTEVTVLSGEEVLQ